MYRCSYCHGDFAYTALSLDYSREYQAEGAPFYDGRQLKILSQPEKKLKEARRSANYRQALKFVKASSSNGRLLDVGASIGVFLKLVEQLGLEVYSLDPAAQVIDYARQNFGLRNTVVGTIDDIPPDWRNFDFITCFEVLEHLEQPRELAERIYELLAPGGYFLMSVPNRNCLVVKLGRREQQDYPPNHLTRWSREVLYSFLTSISFTNVTVKIDGMNRWALGSILLTSRFNQKIIKRKLGGLTTTDQAKREFFLNSPLWKLAQIAGDVAASLLEATIAKCLGTQLIGFAQRPPSDIQSSD